MGVAIRWVTSEVLQTVCFLFKNEFILQNTFTGLQCNLHCALSQWSDVWAILYSCLDAFVVDSFDYSGHFIRHFLYDSEAFPTEWFLQFGKKLKSGRLSPPDFNSYSFLKRKHTVFRTSEMTHVNGVTMNYTKYPVRISRLINTMSLSLLYIEEYISEETTGRHNSGSK
jgi:hypothetical protein